MSRQGSVTEIILSPVMDLGHDNPAYEKDVESSPPTEDLELKRLSDAGDKDNSNAKEKESESTTDVTTNPETPSAPSAEKVEIDIPSDPPSYNETISTPEPKAGFSGGFGNGGFVTNHDLTPEFKPKDGDITDVLSPNTKSGRMGVFYQDMDIGEKTSDPEAATVPERGQWSNQTEFLLSCIAMSVGLGNVWRFPFTAYENGGGAFLIPYLIVLVFVGRPIYFLELCLGQFCSLSQIKVWRINPFFRGVGYASMIGTLLVMSYYCSIMALTVFYFVISFQADLPWDTCNPEWVNSGNCSDLQGKTLAEYYFVNEVLKEKNQIDDGIGYPEWRMSLCLLFSWLVIFGSLIKGVKSSGKVAYFTAIFPYVVLISLLIRGVTLDGAWDGIKYFIEPQWKELAKPKVWYAAVSQCFYSLNTGFGSVIMFSSYNPFKHSIYRDAVILSFMDTFTSLLAGFTIFSVLGYLSHSTGIPVKDVLDGGNGLAFISYPTAIANFPWAPQLFAVLFFLMLFTLGIGSATADAGAIITIFVDQFPSVKRWKITAALCSIAFLCGLIYVTPGGQFILNMVDFYGASFVIFTTSALEVAGIAWFYGLNNFIRDIHFMLDIRIGIYWKICWGLIIPVGLAGILVYTFAVDYEELTYKDEYAGYPTIATVLGWSMAALALSPVPLLAGLAVYKSPEKTLIAKFRDAMRPTVKWGPRDPKIRAQWEEFKKYN